MPGTGVEVTIIAASLQIIGMLYIQSHVKYKRLIIPECTGLCGFPRVIFQEGYNLKTV